MKLLRLVNILSVLLFAVAALVVASMYPGIAALAAICGIAKMRRSVNLTAYGTARWAEASDLGDMIQ